MAFCCLGAQILKTTIAHSIVIGKGQSVVPLELDIKVGKVKPQGPLFDILLLLWFSVIVLKKDLNLLGQVLITGFLILPSLRI